MKLSVKVSFIAIIPEILRQVYRSLVESVLTFNQVAWYGNLTVTNRTKLARIVNQASKIVGQRQINLSVLHHGAVNRKATQIFGDKTHPLNGCFEMLRSGRRLRTVKAMKNLYKFSFVPSAITILNAGM